VTNRSLTEIALPAGAQPGGHWGIYPPKISNDCAAILTFEEIFKE